MGGDHFIDWLTPIASVRDVAQDYLPYAAIYILVSFAAFQLDGIFIGATGSRAMRNAAFFSLAIFLIAAEILVPIAGNQGLWIAFVIYVIARAVTLGLYLPQLRSNVGLAR